MVFYVTILCDLCTQKLEKNRPATDQAQQRVLDLQPSGTCKIKAAYVP